MIFRQNSSSLHWAVGDPIAFSQLWSHKALETSHSRTMASFVMPSLVRMCTKHLAKKRRQYSRSLN